MTEPQPTLLDDLDKTLLDDAAIPRLLHAAQGARRRRQRASLAGAVAATVLVVVGGTLAARALFEPSSQSTDGAAVADGAPSGTRLVGIGKVSIAVPEGWSSNAASCNSPVEDTAFIPFPQDCIGVEHPGVSSVAIAAGEWRSAGIVAGRLQPAGQLSGHDVVQSPAACASGGERSCTQTFAVPDLHAYFHATVQPDDGGRATLRKIRASLSLLPESRAVVPFVANGTEGDVRTVLESAGFAVVVKKASCLADESCPLTPADLEPAVGTVLPRGSTVTVTIRDKSAPTDPAQATSPDPSAAGSARIGLAGRWNVRALVGPGGQSVLPAAYAHKVRLTFKDDQMRGTNGCNVVVGAYEQSGDRGQDLVFPSPPLSTSLAACTGAPPLFARLLDVRHVSGSGDVRRLHAANWMIIAELRRR